MSLRHTSSHLLRGVPSALSSPILVTARNAIPAITLSHAPRRYARNKPFSNLTDEELTKKYREFKAWAQDTFGNAESPTYLGQFDLVRLQRKDDKVADQMRIFPNNRFYKAQPALSEDFKDEIYKRIKVEGKSLRTVAAELGVSMERCAAVVRLREIRKEMEQKGADLDPTISKALHKLMPITPLPTDGRPSKHDRLNTFLVPLPTGQQLFVPIPESRTLTSTEAAKLLGVPAPDELIPHPELIQFESMRAAGIDHRARMEVAKEQERMEKERMEAAERKREEWVKRSGEVIERGRWRWRLKEARVGFVGERYGVPKEDRKKGNQKEWLECRHYAYGI